MEITPIPGVSVPTVAVGNLGRSLFVRMPHARRGSGSPDSADASGASSPPLRTSPIAPAPPVPKPVMAPCEARGDDHLAPR